MKKLTNSQSVRETFKEEKFPQLYSKRGFEKSRIKLTIPSDTTQLAYMTDKNGTRLNVEL